MSCCIRQGSHQQACTDYNNPYIPGSSNQNVNVARWNWNPLAAANMAHGMCIVSRRSELQLQHAVVQSGQNMLGGIMMVGTGLGEHTELLAMMQQQPEVGCSSPDCLNCPALMPDNSSEAVA